MTNSCSTRRRRCRKRARTRNRSRAKRSQDHRQRSRRAQRTKRNQKGGLIPCVPCIASAAGAQAIGFTKALSWLGLGVGASVGAKHIIKSVENREQVKSDGSASREKIYKTQKKGKKMQIRILQKNKTVKKYIDGTIEYDETFDTLKEATKQFDKEDKKCIKSGFKKC